MENFNDLKKIIEKVKINYQLNKTETWTNGSQTYFKELQKEIQETLIEYKANKQVHLEDELGDILWDYLNLLENLKQEGKIESIEKIFQRANKKYTQRIDGFIAGDSWTNIKNKQKKELLLEQNNLDKL